MDNRSGSEELHERGNEYKCILLCGEPCTADDSIDNITPEKWESIQSKSLQWKGLDKFQHVHGNVDWKKGPEGCYMHSSCYTTLSSKRSLSQAEKRKRKSEESLERDKTPDQQGHYLEASAPKKLHSSMGVLHNKVLCVWCGVYKSSDRDKRLLLLSTVDAWTKFKIHTVRLEDDVIRKRLDTASIPYSQTAFVLEIRYYCGCWRKYVSNHKPLSDESTQHLQLVNFREAQTLFFHHVRQVIFKDHEIRRLQGLLQDYKRIISNHGHNSEVKSSYLKEILTKEFGEGIGFHERIQKNVSELVYDTAGAGTYIEAAISSCVSNDQLLMNVAARLKEQVIRTITIPWPPFIYDLEREEYLIELLLKLITWLKHPSKSAVDDSPSVRSIASILTSCITGKRTAFNKTNISVMLHGLTKSREIVDIMHKDGLGISYNDVLMLRDFWVVNDLQHSTDCPFELAEGKPAIAIIDNDDFKSDTLTGAGQSHRTNVMFVQPKLFDPESPSRNHQDQQVPCEKLASNFSTTLNELGNEMQKVNPYKTVKRGEPPIRKQPTDPSNPDTSAQITRGVIHALARAQDDRVRPQPEEQTVPGFSGFHVNMSKTRREESSNIS